MRPKPQNGWILPGQIASTGCAIGRITLWPSPRLPEDEKGSPSEERERIAQALAKARAQLVALKRDADELGAEILEFELELLDDPQLTEPVLARIAGGTSAVTAWRFELDAQITGYRTEKNEMFRPRANDFKDLRDRVLSILFDIPQIVTAGATDAILVARDLTPSRFLEIDWGRYLGAALAQGSAAGHVAMLARARQVPMLFGLGDQVRTLCPGAHAVLDAESGRLIQNPDPDTLRKYRRRLQRLRVEDDRWIQYLNKPAATAAGDRIQVHLNIDDPAMLQTCAPSSCDGIGLVRTELIFRDREQLMDEALQYQTYAGLIEWAGGRPVIVRTLDLGGDKPIDGLTPENETNPYLGVRGTRLSLARPDLLRVQLRALVRAAAHGPLKVMLPMVTEPAELNQVCGMMAAAVQALEREGIDATATLPPLGIMVEVPAAALRVHAFQADFYAIGSNDLLQYVTATSRDDSEPVGLQDPRNPAFLELVRQVVAYGAATGKAVSICGEMASVPKYIHTLLDTGIKSFSVPPARLASTKAAISRYGGRIGQGYR